MVAVSCQHEKRYQAIVIAATMSHARGVVMRQHQSRKATNL
jgi:hypothetical protein